MRWVTLTAEVQNPEAQNQRVRPRASQRVMRVGFRGGREDRAGERASTGIGGLGRPRDHVRPLTSLAAR